MTIFNNNSGQLRIYMSRLAIILSILFSGCSLTGDGPGQGYRAPAGLFQPSKVGHWINELEKAKKLTPEQYKQILTAREIEYSTIGDLTSRLRLSLLLLQGQEKFRIPSRALKIMQGADLTLDGHEQAFALFLLQLAEQQTHPRKVVILKNAGGSGGSKSSVPSQQNQKTYLKEYEDAKARINELEQQLQELTSIEQNIQERESGKLIKEQK